MANILDFGGVRALTSDAQPGAGYVAEFYDSGTTTPVTVYTDSTLGTPHGTSVTADAAGRFAAVWSSGGAVKCVIKDADGATVQTIDPVLSVSGSGSGAEDISFEPTVDLPFTNVQDAIEGAAVSAASGYATFGLGITGNATLLANMDATNIGAGVYRFDNTTTGTYPTGVAAADTGLVEHWRQAAGTAMQFLYHATTDRIFHRRMASSSWGTWRENITTNQGAAQGDTIYRGASAWTRLALGTAYQVARVNSGATAPEWASNVGYTAEQATTSGTEFDFVIPAGAVKVRLHMRGVSLSGTDGYLVQLGAASLTTSGYVSGSGAVSAAGTGASAATNGFVINTDAASAGMTGVVEFFKGPDTYWYSTHNMRRGPDSVAMGGGSVDIGAPIEKLRLTRDGSNTFDAGTASVAYEF